MRNELAPTEKGSSSRRKGTATSIPERRNSVESW